jgi:hypothetical protein
VNAIGEESEQSRTLRAAGFTYDRVSPSMLSAASASGRTLQVGANHYRALLVDDAHAPDPALLETLQAASAAGVPIVWVGAGPARAFGLRDTEARDARVKELWSNLAPRIVRVSDAARVAAALRSADVLPEVEVPAALGTIGIAQRDTEQGRLIWLFNESALPQLVRATVRNAKAHAQWLDPSTGRASDVALEPGVDGATLWLALPGARGGLLLLTD